jgi:hypothetical protein
MKTRIQLGIRHFNENQLDAMLVIIQEALEKQREILLLDAVKKNPHLVEDMKQIIKEEVRHDREEKEDKDRKKEAEDFDFDSELESVFNDIEK